MNYNQKKQCCSLQATSQCSETSLYPSSLTTLDNLNNVLYFGISMKEGDAWHTHVYFLSVHSEHLAREQLLGYLADDKPNIRGGEKKEAFPYIL